RAGNQPSRRADRTVRRALGNGRRRRSDGVSAPLARRGAARFPGSHTRRRPAGGDRAGGPEGAPPHRCARYLGKTRQARRDRGLNIPSPGRLCAPAGEPVGLLPIDGPALPPQQDMHAPVAEAHAGLANLLDPLFQSGLTGTARLVPIRLRVKPDRRTGSADRYGPFGTQRVDQRSLPARPQSFRLMTSCSISLSSVRSATIFFSRAFSCSSSRSRFISDGIMPEYVAYASRFVSVRYRP